MSDKQLSVRSLIIQPAYQKRFEEVLQKRAPQFIASVTSQCTSGPLANCSPQSVIAAAFIAATLDLPVDRNLGFAWIVPYKGTAQFQMGYRGYIQLALRTGQYDRLNAFSVNKEAWGGYDEFGEPSIDMTKLDEEEPAVAYALKFRLVSGFTKCIAWTKKKVEKHAKRFSQSFGKGASSPWTSDFDSMALKTVIANGLKKWGILSVDMQRAFTHDHAVQVDIDADVSYPDADLSIPQGRIGQTSESAEGEAKPLKVITPTEAAAAEKKGKVKPPEAPVTPPAADDSGSPFTEPAETTPQVVTPPQAEEPKAPKEEPISHKARFIATIARQAKALGAGRTVLEDRLIDLSAMPPGRKLEDLDEKALANILDNWDEVEAALKPKAQE